MAPSQIFFYVVSLGLKNSRCLVKAFRFGEGQPRRHPQIPWAASALGQALGRCDANHRRIVCAVGKRCYPPLQAQGPAALFQ
jgi:hypothetical protein